jgi:hypothetical protein
VLMGEIVSMDFYHRWMSLYRNIQSRSIKEVAEEAAYTWFNRFMAIRIMEKQDFAPLVLEYESEEVRVPMIVSEARQGRMPQMSEEVRDKLMGLLEDDSKTSEQFALLIVAYCHENPIINKCFGAIADYTELLLPQNILSDDGFVYQINHTEFISDEQYASAELIGWLYQFYIADRKAEAMAKKGKYDTDEIAPATQIFTPNWIVKYMVENTVGRIYIDNNPYCELKDSLNYLVDIQPSNEPLKVEELSQMKVADLACGSGHILNECFDLLYKIYIEEYYSPSVAIKEILQKNLLGIDLDTRAKQLATFALLMKACQKDRAFLDGKVMPRVYDMPRPIAEVISADNDKRNAEEYLRETLPHYLLGGNDTMVKELTESILLMNHADTLGSIMKFDISESTRNAVLVRTQKYEEQLANGEMVPEAIRQLMPYMNIILALTEKYAAICMNPPYMGAGRFDEVLSKYVKDNYVEAKADLFSVFMDMGMERLADGGKMAQINMQSWMFLSSFEKLRNIFLHNYIIDSMLHLGPRTFDELSGEVVQNTAFVFTKPHDPYGGITLSEVKALPDEEKAEWKRRFMEDADKDLNDWMVGDAKGTYYRLVDGKNCADKEQLFLSHKNSNDDGKRVYYPNVEQKNFEKIPGCPIGYWVSEKEQKQFIQGLLSEYAKPCKGIDTGENSYFLRIWNEVSLSKIDYKTGKGDWVPYNKGGGFRRWYGFRDYVLRWNGSADELSSRLSWSTKKPTLRNRNYWFREAFTWSSISSDGFSARYCPHGALFDNGGSSLFSENNLYVIGGLVNSKVANRYFEFLAPTLNFQPGDVGNIAYSDKLNDLSTKERISELVQQNISISKSDWDSHETSWDFQGNELLTIDEQTYKENIYNFVEQHFVETGERLDIDSSLPDTYSLAWRVEQYKQKWEHKFMQLHKNEEELNRQFIDIYGLQDELTPDVPLDEITILQQGEISIEDNKIVWHDDVLMKQLISYAVGCMMGRYSIDHPGLILANQGDGVVEYEKLVPNSRFEVDDDGIIPLMSSMTDFADNATVRLKKWISVVFGEDTLVENLNFIEAALGKSLDDYFVKDFWKYHKKMYQNRPIYWLFSSKKGAFQCLAYMHRITPYTAEQIRTKYLLPHIEWLVQKQNELEANAANLDASERRDLDRLTAQITECREYHDRLHEVADEQIAFDLDDGVVVNYAKFGDVLQKIK